MQKSLGLSFISLCFLACGEIKNLDEMVGTDKRDITNLSICSNPTPVGYSLYSRDWKLDLTDDNNVLYQQVFHFDPGLMSMTVSCSKGSENASAYLRVTTASVGTQVTTTTGDAKEVPFSPAGENGKCGGEIKSGVQLVHSFRGPCLVLQEGTQTRVLVPATL